MAKYNADRFVKFKMGDTPCPECGDRKAYETLPDSHEKPKTVKLKVWCTNRKCFYSEEMIVDYQRLIDRERNQSQELDF